MTSGRQSIAQLEAEARRLFSIGQLDAAVQLANSILQIQPNNGNAINLLGVIFARQGKKDQALDYFRRLVALNPKSHDAHANLANALNAFNITDLALKHYNEASRLAPSNTVYLNNLGALHLQLGQLQDAKAQLERSHRIDPHSTVTIAGLYNTYRALAAANELEQLTRWSTQNWPSNAEHWLHRAEALFELGRLKEAWSAYRWRFKDAKRPVIGRAVADVPLWNGEDLGRKAVLVFTEQGPGDEVMYGTMIADILPRVGRLGIICSPRMAPLFRRSFPSIDVFAEHVPQEARASFDVQCSLVDFAEIVRPTLESFSGSKPYLVADNDRTRSLRATYLDGTDDLLIGIAWRSSGVDGADEKSVPLSAWGPFFSLPKVRFVNLQYGDCKTELARIKTEHGINVIADESIDPLTDLDGFAAQIAAMDIVISSSNTAAHFAGSQGVSCYCMLPATSVQGRRWHWLRRENDCAWYASVKLFSRTSSNSWISVVGDVVLRVVAHILNAGYKNECISYLLGLAKAYRASSLVTEAFAALEQLAKIPGQELASLSELSSYSKQLGRYDEALQYLDRARAIDPENAHILNLKGMIYAAKGELIAAEHQYRHALSISPNTGEFLNNLGTAVRRQGRGLEAHECYVKAQTLLPDNLDVLQNLSANLIEINRPAEAIPVCDRIIAMKPDHAEAHTSRAFALLTLGQFAVGWPEMWWRQKAILNLQRPPDDMPPRWKDQPLAGRTVLVWTEYGLGDEILALSMLPDVIAAAEAVTVLCSERLVPILTRSFPTARILERSEQVVLDLTRFDFQMSISEMGAAFRQTLDHFPLRPSFLRADERAASNLRRKYASIDRPIVGLSWASGNPEIGAMKSMTLYQLMSGLTQADSKSAAFVSLQYGDHAAEIREVNKALSTKIILDREIDAIKNVDSFAAQVSAMDLVITVSNTTAHVAGALGVPTVLLLPFSRGRQWYWLRASRDCKWYRTIKYVFQAEDGTWDDALKGCQSDVRSLFK